MPLGGGHWKLTTLAARRSDQQSIYRKILLPKFKLELFQFLFERDLIILEFYIKFKSKRKFKSRKRKKMQRDCPPKLTKTESGGGSQVIATYRRQNFQFPLLKLD